MVSAGGAHTLVLVVGHEQAGQRDLSTPGVQRADLGTLRGRKEQLLRAAYLTAVRSDAQGRQLPGAPAGRIERQDADRSTLHTARTLVSADTAGPITHRARRNLSRSRHRIQTARPDRLTTPVAEASSRRASHSSL